MRLLELKQYFKDHKLASVAAVCQHFAASPDIVTHMIGRLVCAKVIKPLAGEQSRCGSGCSGCPLACDLYVWQESAT